MSKAPYLKSTSPVSKTLALLLVLISPFGQANLFAVATPAQEPQVVSIKGSGTLVEGFVGLATSPGDGGSGGGSSFPGTYFALDSSWFNNTGNTMSLIVPNGPCMLLRDFMFLNPSQISGTPKVRFSITSDPLRVTIEQEGTVVNVITTAIPHRYAPPIA